MPFQNKVVHVKKGVITVTRKHVPFRTITNISSRANLNELRKFKAPYVTGTEVVHPIEEPVPRTEGLDDEILITLREIQDILKSQKTLR